MKARLVAGLYGLSDPRTATLVLTLLLAVLAAMGALLPAHLGASHMAGPVSGGGGNG